MKLLDAFLLVSLLAPLSTGVSAACPPDDGSIPPEKITLLAPKTALKGKPFVVELHVPPSLIAQLQQSSDSRAEWIPKLDVHFCSDGFKVNPPGTYYEQAILAGSPTKWRWGFEGKEDGDQEVVLVVGGFLRVDGKPVRRDLLTKSHTISVSTDLSTWAKEYWQWIVTTLLLPPAGWLISRVFPGQSTKTRGNRNRKKK